MNLSNFSDTSPILDPISLALLGVLVVVDLCTLIALMVALSRIE